MMASPGDDRNRELIVEFRASGGRIGDRPMLTRAVDEDTVSHGERRLSGRVVVHGLDEYRRFAAHREAGNIEPPRHEHAIADLQQMTGLAGW
jgi:hypothetical protein